MRLVVFAARANRPSPISGQMAGSRGRDQSAQSDLWSEAGTRERDQSAQPGQWSEDGVRQQDHPIDPDPLSEERVLLALPTGGLCGLAAKSVHVGPRGAASTIHPLGHWAEQADRFCLRGFA